MWRMIERELKTNLSLYTNLRGLSMILVAVVYPMLVTEITLFSYFILIGGLTSVAFTEMESRDRVYISILSGPCKRSDYVFGKFIANLIWVGIITVVGLVLNAILNGIAPAKCLAIDSGTAKLIVSYMLIFIGVYYLLYFSLGIKWAKIGYFVVFFAIMVGAMGFEGIIKSSNTPQILRGVMLFLENNSITNNIILIVIVGGILSLFAYISFMVYDRKDF